MKNNLYNMFANRNQNSNFQNGQNFNNRFNSMNDFFDRFSQFKASMTEDPEQKLQELLNNGTMSQQQYNMLYGLAKKIVGSN